MGLFLRKKSSKASLKAAKEERKGMRTPPPQLPPLPDHIRRAEAAAAAAAAATPAVNNKTRRRSRSLWADSDEAKAAAPFSSAGDLASQPWRSHDAWMAFQQPSTPKAVLDELIFPCSPSAQPGWRGRGGGGLFSTEGMLDLETIRRAATPTVPNSPSSARRFLASPPLPSPPARRLDFESARSPLAARERSGSESQSTQSTQSMQSTRSMQSRQSTQESQATTDGAERAPTPPDSLLMTPRARGSYPTDASPSNTSPDMLITPHSSVTSSSSSNPASASASTSLLPGFSSPTPGAQESTVAQRRRSPSRALPPPPIDDDEVPEEVIDFTTSPLAAPIQPYSGPKIRSNSASSSQYVAHRTSSASSYMQSRSAPSPGPYASNMGMQGMQAHPQRTSSASPFVSPVMSTGALPDAPMRLPPSHDLSMRLPPAGSMHQSHQSHPRRPSASSVTMPSTPSMLPYAQPSPAPSPQPGARRSAPRTYEQRQYEQRHYDQQMQQQRQYEQRPPSRNTSNGSRENRSRPPSRTASSSGHGHSGYHSDAASAPLPHTPEGIAQAVSLWRRKSQRREVEAAVNAGMLNPPASQRKQDWENTDVFAAAGAWEAPGAYNPYDAAEFEQHSFTAPLRLPKAAGVPAPHAIPSIVRRPSAGHSVNAAQIGRSPRVQQQVAQPGWI